MTAPRPQSRATATLRFSTLGIVAVATILATGSVNTWYLAGSIPALIGTDYGRLLLIKIALFLVMVAIAAVNRLRLTPRLVQETQHERRAAGAAPVAPQRLLEATAGAIVLGIVGLLGTLPPGSHANHHPVRRHPRRCHLPAHPYRTRHGGRDDRAGPRRHGARHDPSVERGLRHPCGAIADLHPHSTRRRTIDHPAARCKTRIKPGRSTA